jgi:hypothetical protein
MKNVCLVVLITLSCFACSKKESAKPVDYYVSHIDDARQVVAECQGRIKNASDAPAIWSEANCANASLAIDQWTDKYTKNEGKKVRLHPYGN